MFVLWVVCFGGCCLLWLFDLVVCYFIATCVLRLFVVYGVLVSLLVALQGGLCTVFVVGFVMLLVCCGC